MRRHHPEPPRKLPAPGTLLTIASHGMREQQSRVDSHLDGDLCITPVPAAVATGASMRLSWTSPRGWCDLAGQLIGPTQDRVPLWRVRPLSEVAVTQRRSEARVSVVSPVEIVGPGLRPVRAMLVDLSAGGARCLAAPGTTLREGDPVSVDVDTGQWRVLVAGTVARRVLCQGERVEVAVRWRQPVKEVERLRREVLRLQRLEQARASA